MSVVAPTSMDAEMQQFFAMVEIIKADMHSITEKQRMLQVGPRGEYEQKMLWLS